MVILRFLFRAVLLFIGLVFLGSGLYCGVAAFNTSWIISSIGIVSATLGLIVIIQVFTKLGRVFESADTPAEPPEPPGKGRA